MASSIGSLVVDLLLKSAEFNADLAKTSKNVARNASLMQRSFASVQRSVSAVTAGFAVFASARTVRQISRVVEESLKFAATLEGPLGDSARKFTSQFEELQNQFEVGLASAFLDELNGKLINSKDNLLAMQEAGAAVGPILADAFIAVTKWVATLPAQIHEVQLNLAIVGQTLERWANNTGVTWLYQKFTELAALAPQIKLPEIANIPGANLVQPDTSVATDANTTSVQKLTEAHKQLIPVLTEENARLLENMQSMEFWNAQILTAGGDVQIATEQLSNHRAVIESMGGPLEQYALALQKIQEGNYSAADSARLHSAAVAEAAGAYLALASQVSGALATVFKDNKAVAVANAVISTAEAIVKTLAQYGATPWGIAAAAAAAATGAAQIATILSTQPGSSKKPTAAAAGGASAATSSGGGGGGSRSPRQAVTINLMGQGGFTRDQVRQLADELNGLVADGATIRTS